MRALSLACLFLATCVFAQVRAGEPLQPPYNWRGIDGSGVFPAGDLVTDFREITDELQMPADPKRAKKLKRLLGGAKPGDRKNIVWRTLLPHWGHSTPIVVGDRVFVTTEEGWQDDAPQLVCLSAVDGEILWKGAVDHMDAWPPDKAEEGRRIRALDLRFWREFMVSWNRVFVEPGSNRWAWRPVEEMDRIVAEEKAKGFDHSPKVKVREKDGRKLATRDPHFYYGIRGRFYWNYCYGERAAEMKRVVQLRKKHRYHIRPHWVSEGPFYGTTFASPVSDGEYVYALCHPDAVACYDLEGNRRWAADLGVGGRNGFYRNNHTDIASPVLVGDVLVCWSSGEAVCTGLDKGTGERLWRVSYPGTGREHRDWKDRDVPRGYKGHMGPGGTPVVMRIADETVVVINGGLVVRPGTGKVLGQVHLPAGAKASRKKKTVTLEEDLYGSSYVSWVAEDDVLYCILGGLQAIRLGIEGDKLTQEVLWSYTHGAISIEQPNLVASHGVVTCKYKAGIQDQGLAAFDLATGEKGGQARAGGHYATNLAVAGDLAIVKDANGVYQVMDLPAMKRRGRGVIKLPFPTGEIAERNIACYGFPSITWANSGIGCWGNRIFIRSHDYLWCIGDPAKKWVPPEGFFK